MPKKLCKMTLVAFVFVLTFATVFNAPGLFTEVFAQSELLSLNRPATSSDGGVYADENMNASNAVNGITDDEHNGWSANTGLQSSSLWLQVDLGQPYQITRLEVFPRPGNYDWEGFGPTGNFEIRGSNTPNGAGIEGQYTVLASAPPRTTPLMWPEFWSHDVTNTTEFRYIRLVWMGGGYYLYVNQLKVFGVGNGDGEDPPVETEQTPQLPVVPSIIAPDARFTITLEEMDVNLTNSALNRYAQRDEVNDVLLTEIYYIELAVDDVAVSVSDVPMQVSVDVSDLQLTTAQRNNFTGFIYNPQTQNVNQLGGSFSSDGNTFIFYTFRSGIHGVAVSDNLTRAVFVIGDNNYELNGTTITNDVAPFILYDRTMVPLRAVAEAFGADAEWVGETQTAVISLDGFRLEVPVGVLLPGGMGMAVMENNRVFVPLRYVSEFMGAHVLWEPDDRLVRLFR